MCASVCASFAIVQILSTQMTLLCACADVQMLAKYELGILSWESFLLNLEFTGRHTPYLAHTQNTDHGHGHTVTDNLLKHKKSMFDFPAPGVSLLCSEPQLPRWTSTLSWHLFHDDKPLGQDNLKTCACTYKQNKKQTSFVMMNAQVCLLD